MHQSVYWRFKDGKTKSYDTFRTENSPLFSSDPPSNVIVARHRLSLDISGGIQAGVFLEFSAFSISVELLLAVQTNSRGRRLLGRKDGRGDGEEEQKKESEEEPNWGLRCCSEEYGWLWCLETEKKLKKKDKIP